MLERFILASSSPRRRDLFKKYNLNFKIINNDVKEVIIDSQKPGITVMSLAFQKAMSVLEKTEANDIIIGADTLVYFEGKMLGKPKDKEEARRMLNALSAKRHRVYTGLAIIDVNSNKKIVDYDISVVKFRKLDEEIIEKYLKEDEYKDKAGSYAIQGKGEIFVESINGSYSNIVGLPISKLDELLKIHFKTRFI